MIKRQQMSNTQNEILALGDSLTYGSIGWSYLVFLPWEATNWGINGDAVEGLYQRLVKAAEREAFRRAKTIILCIGINDILLPGLMDLWPFWRWANNLRTNLFGYHYCRDTQSFLTVYEKILACLADHGKKVVVLGIPKAELGNFPMNETIRERNAGIAALAKEYDYPYVDTYGILVNLAGEAEHGYSWGRTTLGRVLDNVLIRVSPKQRDKLSKKRGLALTLDGIHWNSQAAKAIAAVVKSEQKKLRI